MKTALCVAVLSVLSVLAVGFPQEGQKMPDIKEMMKPAPPLQDAFLEWMIGTWNVSSTFMGGKFDGTQTNEWMLDHQFVKSHEKYTNELGTYESGGAYRVEGGVYKAWWFDNKGNAGSMTGKLTGDAIEWSGTDPHMGPFRGTTKKLGQNEMSWLMEAGPDKDGKYTKVGDGTAKRAPK